MLAGMRPAYAWFAFLLTAAAVCAGDSDLAKAPWSARWISVPGAPSNDYGVYHFRRTFVLASKPATFPIRVTADNRYELFVNGERVGMGPARGDLFHWRYDTYDIARWLEAGKNTLAAAVWNAGPEAPMAQVTRETGFLVAGEGAAERVVDTGGGWKCLRDAAYSPEPVTRALLPYGYYVAGPGDRVDGSRYPWGWERRDYDDSAWVVAAPGTQGAPRYASDSHSPWMLVPRPIPAQEMRPERLARVRLASGVTVPERFPAAAVRFTVPASTKASFLLDNDHLTTAYPELVVSGGAGTTVTMGYAEALFVPGTDRKENRNEVEGKAFYGYQDVFLPDGGERRIFRPLWWRTYRYLKLTIETKATPLTVEDLRAAYTGYPFVRKARLEGVPEEIGKILDTGWRTARLCAHETYMDCPYYEQLQYVGDTRIQALVSYYMSGDGRLARNAIEQINSSRTAEGATFSRAPSRLQQYIPPFSLWWIGMLHDYWMYQDDPAFVRQMLPGVHAVLSFFAAHQDRSGSLGPMPWWNFVDWTPPWASGVPPSGSRGLSAPLDLQLLMAYQWAAGMETVFGSKALAAEYAADAARLVQTIQNLYWVPGRRMYADTPGNTRFSQHTQALAVLAGVIQGPEAHDLIERTMTDTSLVQCSIYFRYYLHAALVKAGGGDQYLDALGEWRSQLARGLTTWAESFEPSRSDCHAWGSSSAAPGFRRVRIEPHLGSLTEISGTIPHPKGEVAVSLVLRRGKLEAQIALPAGVEGELVWKGQGHALASGRTRLEL
jgi:alpha-L-rhamnosidase